MLALGAASAVLLFVAELATLSYRTIGIGACGSRVSPSICRTTGGAAHSHVLWLVALAVLVFSFGAAIGRSRPAALALVVCGALVLVIALAIDAPKLGDLRGLPADYNDVRAHTGAAYTLELVGALLAALAGLIGLRRPKAEGGRQRGRQRAQRRDSAGA